MSHNIVFEFDLKLYIYNLPNIVPIIKNILFKFKDDIGSPNLVSINVIIL